MQVLNVKDESGYLLWPTKCKYKNGTVYPYSIAASPRFKEIGDLLKKFVDANTKAGVGSGIYYLGWVRTMLCCCSRSRSRSRCSSCCLYCANASPACRATSS